MHRTFFSILFVISLGIIISSCAGTSQTAQKPNTTVKKTQEYPSWYPDQKVVSEANRLSAYTSAIDSDSASAVSKAVAWATEELKSAVSDKLESIRSEAVVEKGSDSGLDDPRFLIALRKANKAVEPLVETGQTEVKTTEGYSSYRSFAEVSVPKDKLIERIGKRLAGYEKSWNAMKNSKAFKNF
jgi:hypothetical protein